MLAGILFLLDILAFALVVAWAFARNTPGNKSPESGWFGMRGAEAEPPAAADAPTAAWRRRGPAPEGRGPGWKRPGARASQPPR
jgi:hypothetical protein